MSYILDAVRKADQERRENLTPVAHSLGAQSPSKMPAHSSLGSNWPGIVAGVLIVNLAGWYLFSNTGNAPEARSPIAKVAKAVDTPTIATPAVAQLEAQTSGTSNLSKMPLWQAPGDAQNAVRSLEFSFHVYADDPSKRTIIINGQRVAEKDRISQDLSLSEITSDGVIVQYQNNLLIEIDILEQW